MNRFFGMMPSSEIAKEQHFKDDYGTITVQAGPNGWTVLWSDGGSNYKDVTATTDANWQAAIDFLASKGFKNLRPARPMPGERMSEV